MFGILPYMSAFTYATLQMAQTAEASDWPLKNSTTAAVVTGKHQIDDLNNNAHPTGPQRDDMNGQVTKPRDRTMLRYALGITVLAFVSLILSIAVTVHLHIGPGKYLLVAWITVSGGLLWLSGVPLLCVWLSRRKATATKPEDEALEMKTFDGTSKHDTQNHPTADSQPQVSAPSLPEACFDETRGRMPGQDYKRPSKAFSANNLNKTATTPIKAALIKHALTTCPSNLIQTHSQALRSWAVHHQASHHRRLYTVIGTLVPYTPTGHQPRR
ncbi:hypothetical protein LTR15_008172 [Elasticomyces elasticus]|nr:hypothetical protein LTR15_008172 [Elasticomyces elasticus]